MIIEEKNESQNLEQLSAYLDNALSLSEIEQLEARLAQDPQLRIRLEKLQFTKSLIRDLPRVRAPHNFTIKPDMVKVYRKKRQPLFTSLRLASSLAAILLVVLLGVDLILLRDMMTRSPAEPKVMMEAAVLADEVTPEPLILWAEPVLGQGEADGLGSSEMFMAEEPMVEAEIAPMEEAVEEPETAEEMEIESLPPIEDEPEPEVAEIQPMDEEPEEEPEPEEPAVLQLDEDRVEQPLILGVNPEEGGEIIRRSQPYTLDIDVPDLGTHELLRWLQIGLAAIAMGGGVTLWFLKRSDLS